MKKQSCLLIILLGASLLTCAQQFSETGSEDSGSMLNIYLDCEYCDQDYFRTGFRLVNYVNDRRTADVHIIILSIRSGGGGSEYTMVLIGKGRYRTLTDTIVFNIPPDQPEDRVRSAILNNMRLGLVPYIMRTPQRDKLILYVDDASREEQADFDGQDAWRNWMFRFSGSGSIFNQKSDKNINFLGQIYISKVDPDVKFESQNTFGYNETSLKFYDGDSLKDEYYSALNSYTSSNLYVRSIGSHFGAGGVATLTKSHFSNLAFQLLAGPAIEYNIFSYEEATRRQFRIIYAIMFEHTNYVDSTVHSLIRSELFTHEMHLKFMQVEPWGSVNISTFGSSYFNEHPSWTVGTNASADVYLFKGFSFSISVGFTFLSDQYALRKDLPDAKEWIIGEEEMQTDYSFNVTAGISYRFGSIYNNTVNPRFGD